MMELEGGNNGEEFSGGEEGGLGVVNVSRKELPFDPDSSFDKHSSVKGNGKKSKKLAMRVVRSEGERKEEVEKLFKEIDELGVELRLLEDEECEIEESEERRVSESSCAEEN